MPQSSASQFLLALILYTNSQIKIITSKFRKISNSVAKNDGRPTPSSIYDMGIVCTHSAGVLQAWINIQYEIEINETIK